MGSASGPMNELNPVETVTRSGRGRVLKQNASALTKLNTGVCSVLGIQIYDKQVLQILYSAIKKSRFVNFFFLASAVAKMETLAKTKKVANVL